MSIRKPDSEREAYVTATHEALFTAPERARESSDDVARCDACGGSLEPDDDGDDEGFAIAGRGVYLWTRGDEIRFEEAPLCPACASAIGMSALARWEIEEEEG